MLTQPANDIYFHIRRIIRQRTIDSYINDRTYTQLKNSGEMRLIKDKSLSDSMMSYYKSIPEITYALVSNLEFKQKLRENIYQLFRADDYDRAADSKGNVIHSTEKLYLKSIDEKNLNECAMQISEIKSLSINIKAGLERLSSRIISSNRKSLEYPCDSNQTWSSEV